MVPAEDRGSSRTIVWVAWGHVLRGEGIINFFFFQDWFCGFEAWYIPQRRSDRMGDVIDVKEVV